MTEKPRIQAKHGPDEIELYDGSIITQAELDKRLGRKKNKDGGN